MGRHDTFSSHRPTRRSNTGTPRWMAPEMMQAEVKFGPSADIYSFGVVMWEVWSRRKPWSELNHKQEIFKAVRDDKRSLKSPSGAETIEDYEELMRSCTAYKVTRRPLIDSVRSDLQALLERAAEVDSKNVESTRRDSTGFQGNSSSRNSSAVHIEMGTISEASSSLNDNKSETLETKLRSGEEVPLKL